MNVEPFLASTFVPWTVNGPTALPHGDILGVTPASPSGMIPTGLASAVTTSAARVIRRFQPKRLPARGQLNEPDPLHVATGKMPPVPHGRREESSSAVIG